MSQVRLNRRLNARAARLPGVNARLRGVAGDILANAKASAPRDDGDYARSLKVQKGKIDYHVVAEVDYAAAVEFGHHSRLTGDWIAGQHILGKAADSVT